MTTSRGPLRLSADVGGTFTDVAACDEPTGRLKLGKTLAIIDLSLYSAGVAEPVAHSVMTYAIPPGKT